jgi:hypothetical protein
MNYPPLSHNRDSQDSVALLITVHCPLEKGYPHPPTYIFKALQVIFSQTVKKAGLLALSSRS